MRGAGAVLGTVVLLLLGAQRVVSQCKESKGMATEIGARVELGQTFPVTGSVWPITESAAIWVRLQIRLENAGDCEWILNVRDALLRPVQSLTAMDFARGSTRWTERVSSVIRPDGTDATVHLEMENCGPGARRPRIRVLNYVRMDLVSTNRYYSRRDPANPNDRPLFSSGTTEIDRRRGDTTGFLMTAWLKTAWTCSGIMLTNRLFLTNWHCGGLPSLREDEFWNPTVIGNTVIDLSWDGDLRSREYSAERVIDKDSKLDLALLEVQPLGHGIQLPALEISGLTPPSGRVTLFHHPEAKEKHISTCVVIDASWADAPKPDVWLTHSCDSEKGSSGGPLLYSDRTLAALHRAGFNLDPKTCLPTDNVNKAVRGDAIAAWLQTIGDPLVREIKVKR